MSASSIYAQYGEAIRSVAFIIGFWALLFAYYHFFGRKAKPAQPCKKCGNRDASEGDLCSLCWWDLWWDEGRL